MTAPLKRGLVLAIVIGIVGVVGCTTTMPFITSFTGLPATMDPAQTATLTAVGGPGSSAGLWTWSFSVSPAGCGTLDPASYPPGTATTVTTTFTAGLTPGACTVTVTLMTASGRTVSASQTTTIGAPILLPECTSGELVDSGVPSGSVDNHPITGNVGDRVFAYVQVYDDVNFYDDTILHLRATSLASPSNCPATGDAECDDDDGATYRSIGGTYIAYGFNSIITGHPLPAASSFVAVNGYGGDPVSSYRLYRHVVPAANLVIPPSDPGNTPATAFSVPTSPTLWMIGEQITSGDQDWYKFYISAGQAIFVALDSSPDTPTSPHDEGGASWNAAVALHDSNGNVLNPPGTINGASATGSPAPPGEGFAIRINTAGNYYIVVSSTSGIGAYHLTACRIPSTTLPAGGEEPLPPPTRPEK